VIDLAKRLHEAISTMALARREEKRFSELARALFEKQYAENPTYRALCDKRKKSPATVDDWQDIPAATASAFKTTRLACFPSSPEEIYFETSGTTVLVHGRHYFRTLEFYRAAALRAFKAYCLPDRGQMQMMILGPTAEKFPHSSLGFMFSQACRAFGAPASRAYFSAAGLNIAKLLTDLKAAICNGEPVFLMGTSLALLELMFTMRDGGLGFDLPTGSRVLDTGGYKGSRMEISRPEFVEMLGERLGLSSHFIINEYGMTELSSQFYESRLPGAPLADERPTMKFTPPWTRVAAVDPATLDLLPDGETGMLRIYDLANVDSVLAIQTEDLGRAWPDRMELLRRATGAELRGCSLLTESILRMA
jgi:phenylacetate-coenzyme A ligase PaaK-like adenylate-forming protein